MSSRNDRKEVMWPEDDVVELLAQLDFLVEWPETSRVLDKKVQRDEADKKVISQLSKKIDGKYTPRQVERKLLDLYKEGDPSKWWESNFTQVFCNGSSRMMALSDGIRRRVKERYTVLSLGTPRSRRSSKRPAPSTVPPTPPVQRVGKRRKTPSRTTRCQSKSRKTTPLNNSSKRWYNRSRTSKTSPSVVITPIKQELSSISRTYVNLHPIRAEVSDSMDEDSYRSLTDEPPINTLLTPDAAQFDCPQRTPGECPESPQSIIKIAIDVQEYEDLMLDLSDFKQKRDKAEAVVKQLQRESREQKALNDKKQGYSFSYEAEIRRKNARIAELEIQVSSQSVLQPSCDWGYGELNIETLRSKVSILERKIAALDHILDFEYPDGRGNTVEWSAGLLELTRTALSNNLHSYTSQLGYLLDHNIPPQWFVQALIGAAVCKDVFGQEFRCFEMMNTSLLDEYRNQVTAACDKNVLRSIDFASHRSIVQSDYFRNTVIPRKAANLAAQNLDILASLIAEKEYSECKEVLRRELEGIFTVSFDIRVLLMITKDTVGYIWPTPGSTFEVETMEPVDLRNQKMNEYDQAGGPRVVLPVAPGLRVYTCDRQTVNYSGFLGEGDHVEGDQRVLVKSVTHI
ncbi:unnamed protein product [Periconia digitata]|uniref:Uncharacterized protein n=1 Tax=Periconia digitata TaxID=1303443 RepID=A0A9W4ULN5_9PLEO|nr:unnamed protein product [Periconia digitata]